MKIDDEFDKDKTYLLMKYWSNSNSEGGNQS